ncbi:MAG: galactokinase [Roseiflexaceae bacterium]
MPNYQQPLPDQQPFLDLVAGSDLFDSAAPMRPIVVARAPGRLDLMGGIADYSGSLVLELPLALAAFAAAQADPAAQVIVRSQQADAIDAYSQVALPLADLFPAGQPLSYEAARAYFAAHPRQHWAAYLIGALIALGHERALRPGHGLRLLLDSHVPPGKGVSSSAAIEVAAMHVIAALYGIELSGRDLAILCQKVENLVVGAPCGIMDQMTSACGEQDALLALRCQPAELEPPVALPADLAVWGIDSGIRHAVSGADYGSVRIGAFMGYRIIASLAGFHVHSLGNGRVEVEDPLFGGYLANLTPSLWLWRFRDLLPERMGGAEFLELYGGTTDPVTRVDPNRIYAVRMPTEHPIHEHHRVSTFRSLLTRPPIDEDTCILLGELMYQSHASYSACGLGSDGTDRLVELVRAAGPAAGLYGAKITGGGSGGTVAILGRRAAAANVEAIANHYAKETGRSSRVIGGSSPGAMASGLLWRR